MATSTQISSCSGASLVCLVEDDIPGAQLPRSTPEECSVTQLKRWLLCRSASTTGRKQQLVSRFVASALILSYFTTGVNIGPSNELHDWGSKRVDIEIVNAFRIKYT